MIYLFTGQPGHGKTLHGIDLALDFRNKGRLVYVCNVRKFLHDKARVLPLTTDEFRDWESLPDGSVVLVDECYEGNMLPRRAPGKPVPPHIEQLAKHRHRGFDFIFICQSPSKQMDDFVHDLIEQHIHVRRMWHLPFVRLRKFSYFERNPMKTHPETIKRVKLPKRPMGLYESTELDTTQGSIPWYMIALPVLFVAILIGAWFVRGRITDEVMEKTPVPESLQRAKAGNGAPATVPAVASKPSSQTLRSEDYIAWLAPRVPSQPWSAPAYDQVPVPNKPPRLFCYISSVGESDEECKCVTEQTTRYKLDDETCRVVVHDGQYEPLFQEQSDRLAQGAIERGKDHESKTPLGAGRPDFRAQQARYGQMRSEEIPGDYVGSTIH